MATHRLLQSFSCAEDTLADAGKSYSGDTSVAVGDDTVPCVVAANGGGANTVSLAIASAALQSLAFLATVPCVVTLTGVTVIDGITASTVTLEANVLRQVTAITGDMSAISVGANTTGSGPAGTIKIRALYNA